MGAERLIRIGLSMIRRRHHGLSHVAVSFGLPAEQLAPSGPHQLHQLVPWRLVEGAEQVEEAAVEKRRKLGEEEIKEKRKKSPTRLSAECLIVCFYLTAEDVSTQRIGGRTTGSAFFSSLNDYALFFLTPFAAQLTPHHPPPSGLTRLFTTNTSRILVEQRGRKSALK